MKSFWPRFRSNRGALAGASILAIVLFIAVLAPMLAPADPWSMAYQPFVAPMGESGVVLGTDTMGRDILSGVLYGARVSLMIAVVSTVVSLIIGISLGAIAGYLGGWIDALLMRFTEIFQAVPGFALAIVFVAIFQPSATSVIASIALVSWPPVTRLVRSEFLSLRERDFVQASLLAGQSAPRVIFTQILPNAMSPIIVMGSLMVASAILIESSLSFLGLGDPNQMSWGYMVGSARSVLVQAWWMALFPGLAIIVTVVAINLVGEGVSDGLNVRNGERAS